MRNATVVTDCLLKFQPDHRIKDAEPDAGEERDRHRLHAGDDRGGEWRQEERRAGRRVDRQTSSGGGQQRGSVRGHQRRSRDSRQPANGNTERAWPGRGCRRSHARQPASVRSRNQATAAMTTGTTTRPAGRCR